MSALHDIRCRACEWERADVAIHGGEFPLCPECGSATTWIPRGFATDVYGSEQADDMLWVPGTQRPITYTSARERDRKMYEMHGVMPRGDKVNGARVEYDPLGKRTILAGSGPRTVKSPSVPRKSHRSSKPRKSHERSNPAA
jgi:hypothetical protein